MAQRASRTLARRGAPSRVRGRDKRGPGMRGSELRAAAAPAPIVAGTPSSAGEILKLQRLVGNGAVVRLLTTQGTQPANGHAIHGFGGGTANRGHHGLGPSAVHHAAAGPIQRKLTGAKAIKGLQIEGSNETLSTLISAYNKREKKLSPMERIEKLGQISRYIYAWYASKDTKDIASLGGAVPEALRKLEAQVQEAHEKAVETLLHPKDTGKKSGKTGTVTTPKEGEDLDPKQKALLLLQEIASGKGAIKVQGSGAFVRKAHSMLMRIMESEAGMKLLLAIVDQGGPERPVTIGEGAPPDELKGHLSDPAPTESKAIPQVSKVDEEPLTLEEVGRLSTSLTDMTQLDEPPESDEGFGTVLEPGDIHKAVMEGKRGIKVVAGETETYYAFAPGAEGVYVALIHKALGESTDNVNEAGNSVYTPEFVTLAHELGHALSILAGSATINCEDIFSLFTPDIGTYEAPGKGRKQWTNAEEFSTITAIENEVRKDLGLQLRGGHYAVLDQDLEDRVQATKSLVRDTELFVYKVESQKGTPDKAKSKLEAIRKIVNKAGGWPLKGLSNTQKRKQCAEYENVIKTALKDMTALGKGVTGIAKALLLGESKPYGEALAKDLPAVLPKGLQ